MRFEFEYTGLRVRNLDAAIDFFTNVLGMKLLTRRKADWNKGEYGVLANGEGGHKLELNWYADDSPVAGPYREGDELDHLGFAVDDFDGALARPTAAGYRPALGPFHEERWHIAFVPVVEGIWLDVYHVDRPQPQKAKRRTKTQRRRKR